MANTNCSACDELRQTDPNLIVNGLGDTECASLQNNTGLNPSSGNDDCEDLNAMNDCLVKNMETEIDSYNVCSWKEYMKALVGNLWTVNKGIISAICGLWTNIKNLRDAIADLRERDGELCKLIDQIANPVLIKYGILPLADTEAMRARRCGTATSTVRKLPDDGSLNPYTKMYQNIGILYASLTTTSCTSSNKVQMEWIAPSHYLYELVSGASDGDVLWKITKSEAQSVIGISDYLWNVFTESSWLWSQSELSPSRQMAWIEITVGDSSYGLASNEMGVVFRGCTAPNNPISQDNTILAFNSSFARVYKHNI